MTVCKFCGGVIYWINDSVKNHPFNDQEATSSHRCIEFEKAKQSEHTKLSDSERLEAIQNLLVKFLHEFRDFKRELETK